MAKQMSPKCPNCGNRLHWHRETASEPENYECREIEAGCGWRFSAGLIRKKADLRFGQMRGA